VPGHELVGLENPLWALLTTVQVSALAVCASHGDEPSDRSLQSPTLSRANHPAAALGHRAMPARGEDWSTPATTTALPLGRLRASAAAGRVGSSPPTEDCAGS